MHHLRRITGAAAFFALAVLWSNLWGQIRDSLQLGLFTGAEVHAYLVAVAVPFTAPQVISTALAAAMVPVLVKLRDAGQSQAALRVAGGIVAGVGLVIGPLALLGIVCSGLLLRFYSWQPGEERTLALAIELSRLLFPYLLISGVAGAVAATLQSFEKFRPLAVGQLLPNVAIVASMLALHLKLGVKAQALGVVLGGTAYLCLVLVFYYRLRMSLGGSTAPHNGAPESAGRAAWRQLDPVREIARAVVPLLLFGLADWISSQLLIIRAVSWVQGVDSNAFSKFQSAYRLLQVPQGIFVAALSMVLLPHLSGFASSRDWKRMSAAAADGIRLVLYTVTPTVLVLGSLALPALTVLYRHGHYSGESARLAAPLVAGMAPSVIFSAAAEVLVLCLLALKKPWPLLGVQALSLAVSAALSWSLAVRFGLPGIAAAVSLMGLVNVGLFLWVLRLYLRMDHWQEMAPFLWKLGAACMGVWIWLFFFRRLFEGSGGVHGLTHSLLEIGIAVGVSAMIYIGVSEALKIPEWRLIREGLGRLKPGT